METAEGNGSQPGGGLVRLVNSAVAAYYRQSAARQFRIAFLLAATSVLLFGGTGWWIRNHRAGLWGLIGSSSAELTTGPVVLDVDGFGFQQGDVVWVRPSPGRLVAGDAVLYNWRKMKGSDPGFGPTHVLGKIMAVPGDRLDLNAMNQAYTRGGRGKGLVVSTFEARGIPKYSSEHTLAEGDYLMETPRMIELVNAEAIRAVVGMKLGHDTPTEKHLESIVY